MQSKPDIRWQLQIIFVYYTSYADRNNYRLLKKQNYRRFLFDSQTIIEESGLVYYDIAFQKINKSGIVYNDFLKLIPDIAELVYQKSGRSEAFNEYIHQHIFPLYRSLIQLSEFGQEIEMAFGTEVQSKIEKRLLRIPITQRAFNQYVASSMHGKQCNEVFENFANFLKDFEICPQLVSKSLIYLIYLYLIKEFGNNGQFTIQHFVKILIIVSEISSRKLSTSDLCSNGKIIKLLERMEISIGFDKVGKKILFETATSPSFLKSYCDVQYEEDNCIDKLNRTINKLHPLSARHKNCNDSNSSNQKQIFIGNGRKESRRQENKFQNIENITNILSQVQKKDYSKQMKEIKAVFEQLCQFGEVANSKTLKSFKIKKLFERIKIISIVGQPWLDIQIVNLKKNSQTGKIQLAQFLELLALTTKKINVSFEDLVSLILNDQHKLRIMNKQQNMLPRRQYTEQQQQSLKQIFQCCQKPLERLFKKSSQDKLTINFPSFSKMMYQFEIFPVIISKNKLYQIFCTLNDIREETMSASRKLTKIKEVEQYLKDKKQMDFTGFLMGLIEISQEICDDSLDITQKLIVLLQKINQSEGYKKLSLISLVSEIRKKFGKLYVRNFQNGNQCIQDFDQLLENFV